VSRATKARTERTQQIRVRRVGVRMERRRDLVVTPQSVAFCLLVVTLVAVSVLTAPAAARGNAAYALYGAAIAFALCELWQRRRGW